PSTTSIYTLSLHDALPIYSIQASIKDRQWILDFLNSLPLALESEQLRVVHACWHQGSIDQLRNSSFTSLGEAYADFVQHTALDLDRKSTRLNSSHVKISYA